MPSAAICLPWTERTHVTTIAEHDRLPAIVSADYASPLAKDLERIWETRPGFIGWLSSVDHKEIGIRYLVTAFIFLALGGFEALVMRLQLVGPNLTLLTPAQYNQLFTT